MVLFIAIVLTFLNWIIYHKIFTVYYLGGVGKGFVREFVGSWILAMLEMALFYKLGGVLLKILVVVAMAVGLAFAVREIYRLYKDIRNLFKKKSGQSKSVNSDIKQDMQCNKTDLEVVSDLHQANRNNKMDSSEQENTVLKEKHDESTTQIPHSDSTQEMVNKEESDKGLDINTPIVENLEKEATKKQPDNEIIESNMTDDIMVYCTQCGKKISNQYAFCTYCGSKNSSYQKY